MAKNNAKKFRERTQWEIGKFFLDIAKYMLTVVVLNHFVNGDEMMNATLLIVLLFLILLSFFIGYHFLEKTGRDYKPEPIDKAKNTTGSSSTRRKHK